MSVDVNEKAVLFCIAERSAFDHAHGNIALIEGAEGFKKSAAAILENEAERAFVITCRSGSLFADDNEAG